MLPPPSYMFIFYMRLRVAPLTSYARTRSHRRWSRHPGACYVIFAVWRRGLRPRLLLHAVRPRKSARIICRPELRRPRCLSIARYALENLGALSSRETYVTIRTPGGKVSFASWPFARGRKAEWCLWDRALETETRRYYTVCAAVHRPPSRTLLLCADLTRSAFRGILSPLR